VREGERKKFFGAEGAEMTTEEKRRRQSGAAATTKQKRQQRHENRDGDRKLSEKCVRQRAETNSPFAECWQPTTGAMVIKNGRSGTDCFSKKEKEIEAGEEYISNTWTT
jgi:hypothetical protein